MIRWHKTTSCIVWAHLGHEVMYGGSIGFKSIGCSQTHSAFQHNMLQHCCAQLVADVWPHPVTPFIILQRSYINGVANLEQHDLNNVEIFGIACVLPGLKRWSTTGKCYHQWRFFIYIFRRWIWGKGDSELLPFQCRCCGCCQVSH